MKIVLFILSMSDASFGYLKGHEFETIAKCEQFIKTELILEKGYLYTCGKYDVTSEHEKIRSAPEKIKMRG